MSAQQDKSELCVPDIIAPHDIFPVDDIMPIFDKVNTLRTAVKTIDGLEETDVFTDEALEFNGKRFFIDSDGVCHDDRRPFNEEDSHYRVGEVLSRTEAIYGSNITAVIERRLGVADHLSVRTPEMGQGSLAQFFSANIYNEKDQNPSNPLFVGIVTDRFSFITLPFL